MSVSEVAAAVAVFRVGVWTSDPGAGCVTEAWLRERCLARLSGEGLLDRFEQQS